MKSLIDYYIENAEHFSYAIVGMLLADTNFYKINEHKFFCSQFAAKLLNDIDIGTPKKPEHMHPFDFTKIKDIDIIYEGELKTFCKNSQNSISISV